MEIWIVKKTYPKKSSGQCFEKRGQYFQLCLFSTKRNLEYMPRIKINQSSGFENLSSVLEMKIFGEFVGLVLCMAWENMGSVYWDWKVLHEPLLVGSLYQNCPQTPKDSAEPNISCQKSKHTGSSFNFIFGGDFSGKRVKPDIPKATAVIVYINCYINVHWQFWIVF